MWTGCLLVSWVSLGESHPSQCAHPILARPSRVLHLCPQGSMCVSVDKGSELGRGFVLSTTHSGSSHPPALRGSPFTPLQPAWGSGDPPALQNAYWSLTICMGSMVEGACSLKSFLAIWFILEKVPICWLPDVVSSFSSKAPRCLFTKANPTNSPPWQGRTESSSLIFRGTTELQLCSLRT